MAASGAQKCPKSEKLDEAQALAKSCAGRPDFLPCDGLSICATHSHGKCFKLHCRVHSELLDLESHSSFEMFSRLKMCCTNLWLRNLSSP
ncbi:hypothetical protein fugu_000124 [Takifugu bimaculatus]|uniref:Uncharacterized protein n=1 Tax=Takifugu bimaculatus TaxID=433685 RepID=A0A4Z2CG19_9TELE|nr:hypothetical protein fugu_000124 [Takifugu bimaculatus]